MVDSAALKTHIVCVKKHSNIDGMLSRAGIAAMLLALAACGGGGGDEAPPPPAGLQPTLASIQANVFTPGCAKSNCHTSAGAQQGLILDSASQSYATLVGITSAQSGVVRVSPNNSDGSFLIHKLEGMGPGGAGIVGMQMPADGPPFRQQWEINVIRAWIDDGAKP